MLKIADIVFSLVLMTLAVIQLNDPDPLFWFGLYSVCALTPLLTIVHAPNEFGRLKATSYFRRAHLSLAI